MAVRVLGTVTHAGTSGWSGQPFPKGPCLHPTPPPRTRGSTGQNTAHPPILAVPPSFRVSLACSRQRLVGLLLGSEHGVHTQRGPHRLAGPSTSHPLRGEWSGVCFGFSSGSWCRRVWLGLRPVLSCPGLRLFASRCPQASRRPAWAHCTGQPPPGPHPRSADGAGLLPLILVKGTRFLLFPSPPIASPGPAEEGIPHI